MNNKIKKLLKNKIYYFLVFALKEVLASYQEKKYSNVFYFKVGTYLIRGSIEDLQQVNKVANKVVFNVDILDIVKKDKNYFHWQYVIEKEKNIDDLYSEVDIIISEKFESYEEILPFIKKVFKGKFSKLENTIKMIIENEISKRYSFEEIGKLFLAKDMGTHIDEFCVFFKEKSKLNDKNIYKFYWNDFEVKKTFDFLGIFSMESLFPQIDDVFTLENHIVKIEELKCLYINRKLYNKLKKIKGRVPYWNIDKVFENLLEYMNIKFCSDGKPVLIPLTKKQKEILKIYSDIDPFDIEGNLFERREVFSDIKVNISKYVSLVEFANNFNFKINNFSTKKITFNKEKLLKEIFDTFIITIKEKKNMNIEDLEKWIKEENQDLDKSMFNGVTKELKEYLKTLNN